MLHVHCVLLFDGCCKKHRISFDIIFLMANAGFFSEFEEPKAAKSSALLQQMSASDVKDR
jgi:hypothetical protein